MMKKSDKSIKFNLDTTESGVAENNDDSCTEKDKHGGRKRSSLFRKRHSSSDNASCAENNKHQQMSSSKLKQQQKLFDYLSSEKPIMKMKVEIADDERLLLDSLSDTVIDLDQYLRLPEAKAKDKLWRIPYHFRDNTVVDENEENVAGLRSINRFGEGVADGCFVTLSLPKESQKLAKSWAEIIRQADEALQEFEQSRWSRMTRSRRGSILQPHHVFISPNPELGIEEKLLLLGHRLSLRGWTSELFLGTSAESNALLDSDYKHNICHNTSLDDLNNMPDPDLKSNYTNDYAALTDSEIRYMQMVRSRRRHSLVPPSFEGQSDIRFRRQSFVGGELWSAKVEKTRKRGVYNDKLRLINANFIETRSGIESPLELAMAINQGLNLDFDPEHDPNFDYRSQTQARLFANELTLIVRQHFIAIKESEIVNFITQTGPNVLNSCENIKGFFHLQNRITRLIVTTILRYEDLNQRVQTILFFVRVLRVLEQLGNWNSINILTQSLQCPPIVRLKDTWRDITFNHADDYCDFIQISEDLASGKQLEIYDTLTTFIAIFDDVVDKIKERCGFKIVQIHQHRLRKNWDNSKEEQIMMWVNSEIVELLSDINGNLENTFLDTNLFGKKNSLATDQDLVRQQQLDQKKKETEKKRRNFFHRYLLCPFTDTLSKKTEKQSQQNAADNIKKWKKKKSDDDNGDECADENNEYNNQNIAFQKHLLTRNSLTNDTQSMRRASRVPSCSKFWSITEFHKLAKNDKQQVKQEIVRTLIEFQKKTFCVFEERDEELKDFLLNAKCYSMDACMVKSRNIESDTKKDWVRGVVNDFRRPSIMNGTSKTDRPILPDANTTVEGSDEGGDVAETRYRTRRVMFAQDLDADSSDGQ